MEVITTKFSVNQILNIRMGRICRNIIIRKIAAQLQNAVPIQIIYTCEFQHWKPGDKEKFTYREKTLKPLVKHTVGYNAN